MSTLWERLRLSQEAADKAVAKNDVGPEHAFHHDSSDVDLTCYASWVNAAQLRHAIKVLEEEGLLYHDYGALNNAGACKEDYYKELIVAARTGETLKVLDCRACALLKEAREE